MWLQSDCKGLDHTSTTLQLAKVQEQKNLLYRKIKTWTAVQHLYMPVVSAMHAHKDVEATEWITEHPLQDFPLHLPSSLPSPIQYDRKLQKYKFQLCEAQAYEALEYVCQHLHLQIHMYKHKDKNVTSVPIQDYRA
jgi:hypothetical protein